MVEKGAEELRSARRSRGIKATRTEDEQVRVGVCGVAGWGCRGVRRFFEVSLEQRGLSRLRLETACATPVRHKSVIWCLGVLAILLRIRNLVHSKESFRDQAKKLSGTKGGIAIWPRASLHDSNPLPQWTCKCDNRS